MNIHRICRPSVHVLSPRDGCIGTTLGNKGGRKPNSSNQNTQKRGIKLCPGWVKQHFWKNLKLCYQQACWTANFERLLTISTTVHYMNILKNISTLLITGVTNPTFYFFINISNFIFDIAWFPGLLLYNNHAFSRNYFISPLMPSVH